MILGIGIDIVSISYIGKSVEKAAFSKKVFTEIENAYCASHQKAAERYAGKFAAKEAFMKAIGKGIKQEIWFSQIEVKNHPSGAPFIICHGKARKTVNQLGVDNIHLSISHSNDIAVAVVILEGRPT